MGFMDSLRRILSRAKEEASDVAQVARIKLDIRSLEGRRDHLFREIGRQVYTMQGEGRGFAAFESACADVARIDEQIRAKEEELRTVRGKAPDAADPARTG